jgi:type IV secretory pathway VirB9-like protein
MSLITITYGEGEIPKLIAGLKVANVTPKDGADAKAAQEAAAGCTDWCADRHANELTLQPLKGDTGSTLMVTTSKDIPGGTVRHHYAYELSTRIGACGGKIGCVDNEEYFHVSYTYSADDRAKAIKDWQDTHKTDIAARERQKVAGRLATAQFGGPRIFMWSKGKQDCGTLNPERISDNGQQTVMYFKMNTPISIPNKVEPNGEESLLEWTSKKAPDSGDYMIIHSVPTRIVLRRDKMVCPIQRDPKAPWPYIPSTGTATPDVVREPTN